MAQRMQLVTLVGVWERPDTARHELNAFRRTFNSQAYYRGINGYFRARRPIREGFELRHGDFKVRVENPHSSGRDVTDIARATQTLKWFLKDYTCIPPIITVDRARSYTVWMSMDQA